MRKYKDKDWLYQKYIEEGLSTCQIGKLINHDHKTVCYWLKKFNIP
ncbi:unnamed protein product, partial [marine sediment metagenome]